MAAAALFATVALLGTINVSAETTNSEVQNIKDLIAVSAPIEEPIKLEVTKPKPAEKPEEPKAPAPAEPTKYVVVEGDYLDKIATAHSTTWLRLWQKNEGIAHPDRINVGDTLVIPKADEVLAERALPTPPVVEAPAPVPAPVTAPAAAVAAPAPQVAYVAPKPVVTAPRASSSGNTYTPGQCTWHVKNLKPELPNNLGNADQWYWNAQAQGLATGLTPQVGAAAVRKVGMHVAYVTAVHGDGTITISEMNYNWTPYATRTAVKNASDFYYVY